MKDRVDIRIWMIRNGLRAVDVAAEIGIHQSVLSHWLAGNKTSRTIEDYFRSKGCPEEYIKPGKPDREDQEKAV